MGNTPTDRGAGADSTRTPQADKAPGFPLCPKGHDITGGSVNGRGEGNRRREKGGKGPSIEGTRPGKTGQKGSKVLLGSYRDAGRGRRIIFADGDQKNFRISLRIA